MLRSSHSHWLVGSSTSVLKEDFVSSYHHGDSLAGVEHFSGKLMLPTKVQTLKLNLFLKDEARRKNSTVTPGQITSKVTEVIKHYCILAGYETLCTLPRIRLPSFSRTTSTSINIPRCQTRNLWRTERNLKRILRNCWTILKTYSQLVSCLT